MIPRTLLFTLFSAATLAAAGAAHADDGFYFGGGAGQTHIDEGLYDDEDAALSLFGGYQFTPHLAIEGGYFDFGKIEPAAGPSLDADTLYLGAVGLLPVNDRFALYAKLGVHRWDAEAGIAALRNEDSGTDPTYGFGAQYRVTERLALRAELVRFELDEVDADVAQLQARIDF
jgi:OmpA-OmpF porin, OOP family